MTLAKITNILKLKEDKKKAIILSRYFKTGKGDYGYGDKFLGINMPEIRAIAKQFKDLDFIQVQRLLQNKYHEARMTGLLILVYKVEGFKVPEKVREQVCKFYLNNIDNINNWDLVDVTCRAVVGEYLINKPKSILYKLAKSKNIWHRRIAVISTSAFINVGQFDDTLALCEMLLKDNHDLMHKACGWMLREVYKKNNKVAEEFLEKYAHVMPRTMLRYSIEKMSKKEREYFMDL